MSYKQFRIYYKEKKTFQSLGKNGWTHQDGLEIYSFLSRRKQKPEDEEMIHRIVPVNSKGKSTRCYIEIPQSAIKQFISALKRHSK